MGRNEGLELKKELPCIVEIGGVAAGFELPGSTGETISLADYLGRLVVLYFYPKADTPGCTKQACGFRDGMEDYVGAKVAVLGISPDPVLKVSKFAKKFKLNFPLLADADHAVADAYGVWQQKTFWGRKYMGVVRTTFVIGKDGRIARVFEKVKPEGHEKEVMEWIRENCR
jgi:peroxiredoxin Q/BCP